MPQRGRPRGHFDFMVMRTRRLVGSLAGTSYCNAGNVFLARKLGCSTRSVQRYLKALDNSGLLQRHVAHSRKGASWTSRRLMRSGHDVALFGITRDEVLGFKRPRIAPEAPAPRRPAAPIQPRRTGLEVPAYYQAPDRTDIDGFGNPFHESAGVHISGGRRVDAEVLPPEWYAQKLAEVQAMLDAKPPEVPQELKDLRIKYLTASIARGRAKGPILTGE